MTTGQAVLLVVLAFAAMLLLARSLSDSFKDALLVLLGVCLFYAACGAVVLPLWLIFKALG